MARRKFEMFQYRQALVRMRQGDSDRQIAAARIMGRRTAARLRELALQRNWLDANAAMPEDEAISTALGQPKRASTTISSLAAQRQRIQDWAAQGVSGVAIYAALQRERKRVVNTPCRTGALMAQDPFKAVWAASGAATTLRSGCACA